MRLSSSIVSAYAAAPAALKRCYLSLFWEQLVVRDRQIVEATPTRAFAAALGMAAEGSEKAVENESKTALRVHITDPQQMGDVVIKTQGWLPAPSEFITFLADHGYWNDTRTTLGSTDI